MIGKPEEIDDRLIVEPDRPIIDTHFHLFDRPNYRYMFDDYVADVSAGHNIVASVYVETQAYARRWGPEVMRPLGELEFANGIAAMSESGLYGRCRIGAAIVCHADLRHGDGVAPLLDRALELSPERLRGVRQITIYHQSEAPYRYMSARPPRVEMSGSAFRKGFRHLSGRGLSFDAAIFHTQVAELAELADENQDTTIVLDHMGFAMALDCDEQGRLEVFKVWRESLFDLAQRPNIFCKVGGLGMPPWGFGFEARSEPVGHEELASTWSPYVETAIEAFGTDRCMMESNFPPDRMSCDYVSLWNAMKLIVARYSDVEKANLFHDTAARVYRIEIGTGN